MKTLLILLLNAVLSNQFHVGSFLHERSLAGDWNINITMILEDFEGKLFYCSDSNNNTLDLYAWWIPSSNSSVIYLSYNERHLTVSMKLLCNCDPCHGTMMTFEIIATSESIKMKCNEFQQSQIPKIDIRAPNVASQDTVGVLYLVFASNKVGCLKSFMLNNMKINMNKFKCLFMEKCPRDCDRNTCNDGKCLAYRSNGPLCDCSNASRNGPFCNNHLRQYDRGAFNSFVKRKAHYGFKIRLSWENTITKRFCLMEMVTKYHHVTLIIYENRLMAGTKFLAMANERKINFLTILFGESGTVLKVNNDMIGHRLDLFGEVIVHIGLTRTNASCDMFDGKYDFQADYSDLLPVPDVKSEVIVSGRTETDIKLPIIYSVISFFALLAIVIIVAAIFYCITLNRKIIQTIVSINKDRGHKQEYKENEENYENPNFMSMSYCPNSNIARSNK